LDFQACGYRLIDVDVFYNQSDHVDGVPSSWVAAMPRIASIMLAERPHTTLVGENSFSRLNTRSRWEFIPPHT